MAKKLLKKSNNTDVDYENYLKGKDPLMDLLRNLYKENQGLNSTTWRFIVDNDKRLRLLRKRKEINAERRYR
ncbi:hypothetical protein [Clostridium paraputrificum]|uniref:hypothetical protein n=1 Tax=Clostridium paraputrificum TaxID=29363 RepID=UPI000DD082CB|nr:hypothetical protein [Clostridium paraputrificum]MDB2115661.1 hypothetical protein [Clostridium paraputrificum]